MAKYLNVICFWCNKEFLQRTDTVDRQAKKYGHTCCGRCFGKEPTFRAARSRIAKENNPFKRKTVSPEMRMHLSKMKMGNIPWNKGLTKETNDSVRKNALSISMTRKSMDFSGNKNSNWRGGITPVKTNIPELKEWMAFRAQKIKDDGFRCCKCGGKFLCNQLDVHHIGSRRLHKHLEFDETNCISLCKSCHKEFHKKYGRKMFAPGDTVNWLNEGRLANEMKFSID